MQGNEMNHEYGYDPFGRKKAKISPLDNLLCFNDGIVIAKAGGHEVRDGVSVTRGHRLIISNG